jgi:hypothetical protein
MNIRQCIMGQDCNDKKYKCIYTTITKSIATYVCEVLLIRHWKLSFGVDQQEHLEARRLQ